ncbi:MAG: AsmA family protein [Proteobacteria bacterium]|nr:AsmA family protein [Pseudomonadota bacterium]
MQQDEPQRATHARRRRTAARLACAVALPVVLVASLFIDARWVGLLIRAQVDHRSHREFDFDRLRFGLTAALQPTAIVSGLKIDNAPWATDRRPFARADRVRFVWTWDSFWGEHITIRRLELTGADIDMERDAAGRRNWRLTQPNDTGPGRVRVVALVPQRSTVRFFDAQTDLDIRTRSEPSPAPETLAAAPGLPLTQRIVFDGRLGGGAFSGDAAASEVLTFVDSDAAFALRGQATTPGATLAVEGRAGDILRLGLLDVALRVRCTSLASLDPLLQRTDLPATHPIEATGRLRKHDADWTLEPLALTMGKATTLRGRIGHRGGPTREARGSIDAALKSDAISLEDLAGTDSASGHGREAPQWQDRPIARDTLLAHDARVVLDAARVTGLPPGPMADVHLAASLQQGVLQVEPLRFGFRRGSVAASARLDASHTPVTIAFDAASKGVDIAPLLQHLAKDDALRGTLNGRVALRSQGDTVNAWIAAAQGSLRAGLAGAAMSARLEAKLALDGGRWITSALRPGASVDVRCAETTLDVAGGRAVVSKLYLETDHTRLHGSGSIDLTDAAYRMLLTPQATGAGLLRLDRSIAIDGKRGGAMRTRLVPTPANRPPGQRQDEAVCDAQAAK